MITVRLSLSDGAVTKVSASGHSGYNTSGNDIVCAAVSTLVQTAYLAIVDIVGEIDYERDDKRAHFAFTVPALNNRHDVDVILRAMTVGLKDLSSGYPQFIKLEEA